MVMAEKRKKGDGGETFCRLKAGWNCMYDETYHFHTSQIPCLISDTVLILDSVPIASSVPINEIKTVSEIMTVSAKNY